MIFRGVPQGEEVTKKFHKSYLNITEAELVDEQAKD